MKWLTLGARQSEEGEMSRLLEGKSAAIDYAVFDVEGDLKQHFGDGKGNGFVEKHQKLVQTRPSLLEAAWLGIKQNLIPGVVLQGIGLMVVLGYYSYEPAAAILNRVAGVKESAGYLFSLISTALFGGIIPYLILLAKDLISSHCKTKRKANSSSKFEDLDDLKNSFELRAHKHDNWEESEEEEEKPELPATWLLVARFCFYTCFFGYKGVETDAFYRFQGWMFGQGNDVGTILAKVLFDQFIWNPFYAAPSNTLGMVWKDCDFSFRKLWNELNWDFILYRVPSVLCSTWIVWIPAVTLIYALPSTLQIPLQNLVLCFFVLILSFVSKNTSS